MRSLNTANIAVRKLAVEKCDQDKPDQFEKVFEVGRCQGL